MSNSNVSVANSIFTNADFKNTIFQISFCQEITLENLSFIDCNVFQGININNILSNVIMNSINFNNVIAADSLIIFDSANSNLIMNALSLSSFTYTKSIISL